MQNQFRDLALTEPVLRALDDLGFVQPTEIQTRSIPPLLDGRDLLGVAQTGTGKTAAFSLPIIEALSARKSRGQRAIRALILAPTRELAAQIGDAFGDLAKYTDLRLRVIFGGVNQRPQVTALRRGIDVVVATPGRLLDLHGQGEVDLSRVEHFVLDEADRMLDMGFVHDIRRIEQLLPERHRTLLFSATMPKAIARLADDLLVDPVKVAVTPQATPVEKIDQSVMFVDRADKKRLLADLLAGDDVERAIVFTRTKHGANRLVQQLDRAGLRAVAIHGNKSQGARVRALDGFRDGAIPILVATDVASRGIDVEDVTHVFNYDLPNEPESYVHRIGRTARAGRNGVAIAFCDPSEGDYLRAIERTLGAGIPVVEDHDYHCVNAVPPPGRDGGSGGRRPRGGRGNAGGGSRGNGGGNRGNGGGNRSARNDSGGRQGPPQRRRRSRSGSPRPRD